MGVVVNYEDMFFKSDVDFSVIGYLACKQGDILLCLSLKDQSN